MTSRMKFSVSAAQWNKERGSVARISFASQRVKPSIRPRSSEHLKPSSDGIKALSDFLDALDVVHAGYFAKPVDDGFEVFEVGDIENDVDAGLTIGGARFDVADVCSAVADHNRDFFQHAGAIVGVKRQLDRVTRFRGFFFVARPFDGDAALGFIHQVGDVGAVARVHSYTLAAGHVADDVFAANGIATSRAIDEQVIVAAHTNRGLIAAEDAAHDAGESAAAFFVGLAGLVGAGGNQASQDLARGIFSIADAGE